jgi:serine/threonine protein kinase
MSIETGALLDGRYKLGPLLGKGGMGSVFLAENVRIRRQVAVKVLHRDVAANAELLQRFEMEAQSAARIGSDHIVDIFDFGTSAEGERFMVMELLEGETLKQRIRGKKRLTPAEAAPLFAQLLDGLASAHAAGIVHRDLKPENVFLQREVAGQRDWVKILDFGIARFNAIGSGDEEGSMTRTGVVMGTPFFMSPEQARSANLADHRSDLYSVGAMLFQALTGDVPFRASTFTEMLFKVAFDPQPHPRERNPELDDAICGVILRGMAREQERRFQSAFEFKDALLAAARVPAPVGAPMVPGPPPKLGLPPRSVPDLDAYAVGAAPQAPATTQWLGEPQLSASSPSHPGLGTSPSHPGLGTSPSHPGLGAAQGSAQSASLSQSASLTQSPTQGTWNSAVVPSQPAGSRSRAWLFAIPAVALVALGATALLLKKPEGTANASPSAAPSATGAAVAVPTPSSEAAPPAASSEPAPSDAPSAAPTSTAATAPSVAASATSSPPTVKAPVAGKAPTPTAKPTTTPGKPGAKPGALSDFGY